MGDVTILMIMTALKYIELVEHSHYICYALALLQSFYIVLRRILSQENENYIMHRIYSSCIRYATLLSDTVSTVRRFVASASLSASKCLQAVAPRPSAMYCQAGQGQ